MKTKTSNPLQTILTIVVGFAILFFITEIKYFLWVPIGIGVLGLVSSFLASRIEKTWTFLGKILSYIIPTILMTVIFYFLLFPMALLSRIFGKKDPLKLKRNSQSTFIENSRSYNAESFVHSF